MVTRGAAKEILDEPAITLKGQLLVGQHKHMSVPLVAANSNAWPSVADPRAAANYMLDVAEHKGVELSHLALQKLLYFAHGLLLVEQNRPLVLGHFEAWKRGPVHPVVYSTFKQAGKQTICFRAQAKDLLTGALKPLPPLDDSGAMEVIRRIVDGYGKVDVWNLVNISHAKNSPWDYIVKKATNGIALGLRIPDSLIRERFIYHKVFVTSSPDSGDWIEDTPLA